MKEMTAVYEPGHLFTVREFMELEYDRGIVRYELQEGNLVVKTSPRPRHGFAALALARQLSTQIPPDFVALMEIDVNLELAPADGPGTVRKPDLFIVEAAEYDRVDEDDGMLRASSVRLAVEIMSPGSARMDRVIKFAEYADAGIPHYWLIDLERPISLRSFHLAGPFGYLESEEVIGTYQATVPFPVTVDLNSLVRRP